MASVTLRQIWGSASKDLEPVLRSAGYQPTTSPGYDRALVATIYYNAKMLQEQDRVWVSWPGFMETMSTMPPTAEGFLEGINKLGRPFAEKVWGFYNVAMLPANILGRYLELSNDLVGRRLARDFINIINKVRRSASGEEEDEEQEEEMADIEEAIDDATEKEIEYLREQNTPGLDSLGATYVWNKVLSNEEKIRRENLPNFGRMLPFDPLAIVNELMANVTAEITGGLLRPATIMPKTRCYYLFGISELLHYLPHYPELLKKWSDLVQQGGCVEIFAEVPVEITTGLSPIIGGIGKAGGQEALATLLGEYVGRAPTREEVLVRLLSLP